MGFAIKKYVFTSSLCLYQAPQTLLTLSLRFKHLVESKLVYPKDTYVSVSTEALFIIAKLLNWLGCSINRIVRKTIGQDVSVSKKNEIISFVGKSVQP